MRTVCSRPCGLVALKGRKAASRGCRRGVGREFGGWRGGGGRDLWTLLNLEWYSALFRHDLQWICFLNPPPPTPQAEPSWDFVEKQKWVRVRERDGKFGTRQQWRVWRGGGDDEVSGVVLRRRGRWKDNDRFVKKIIIITIQFYSVSVTTTAAASVVVTRLSFKDWNSFFLFQCIGGASSQLITTLFSRRTPTLLDESSLKVDDCVSLARRMIKSPRSSLCFWGPSDNTCQALIKWVCRFFPSCKAILLYFPSAEKRKQPDQLLISNVLWCGNCFIVDPAWCFCCGHFIFMCLCFHFFLSLSLCWLYNGAESRRAGRLEAACAHLNCSFITCWYFLKWALHLKKDKQGKMSNVGNTNESRLTSWSVPRL